MALSMQQASDIIEAASKNGVKLLAGHTWHILKNTGRAFVRNWSGGLVSPAAGPRQLRKYYRQVSRYSASLAFASAGVCSTARSSRLRAACRAVSAP